LSVRSDSRVSIASKGLLGDKALDVTMGAAAGRALANGATVVSEESDDMAGALRAASQAAVRVNAVLEDVSRVTATLRRRWTRSTASPAGRRPAPRRPPARRPGRAGARAVGFTCAGEHLHLRG
jgi:ABC-type transporter Mla subunit MlaD